MLQIQEKAILDFKKIDTYFDGAGKRSQYINYVIDTQAVASLVEPLERLVKEAILTRRAAGVPAAKAGGSQTDGADFSICHFAAYLSG